MKKPLKAYICGTDLTEIAMEAPDVILHPTIEHLKEKAKCWEFCGIYEIDLSEAKCIHEGRMPWN